MSIELFFSKVAGLIWNYPVVGLCLISGIYFTFFLRFVQFRFFKHAIELISGKFDSKEDPGMISHFQALCVSLSGTVGIGNITGVPIAIGMGGPGAVFWMWIMGLLGMSVKFVEATLGTLYRKSVEGGDELRGGPMYYIKEGLSEKWHFLSSFFAISLAVGAFGIGGIFQSNQAASIIEHQFAVPEWVTGLALSFFVGLVIIGGIKRIGTVASKLVPFMCGAYLFGGLAICFLNADTLLSVLTLIVSDAFSGQAAAGGAVGTVISAGVRRAIFSNEAGLGTAPIAHASVKTNYPIREGVVASLGPFIDTVIVCSITAFVVLISGMWQVEGLSGVEITTTSFSRYWPLFGSYFVPIACLLFAFSTLISWFYYGETAAQFVMGKRFIASYKWIFVTVVFLGTLSSLSLVINISDSLTGILVIPNVVAIFLLAKRVKVEMLSYQSEKQAGFPMTCRYVESGTPLTTLSKADKKQKTASPLT